MEAHHFQQNTIQFDYFSDNYRQFEEDYYRYSTLSIPLVFIEDDLLRTMAAGQLNYFILPRTRSKDHRDHHFVFKVKTDPKNNLLRVYEYQYTFVGE